MVGHGHRIEKCEHGTLLGQCRCIERNKPVRLVDCPGPPICTEATRTDRAVVPREACSLTHHTFLVGEWAGAPTGSVLVVQHDDPEQPELLLKAGDVAPFCAALLAAHAGRPIPIDSHDLST